MTLTPAVLALVFAVIWLFWWDNWLFALTLGVYGVASVMQAMTTYRQYTHGYWRGRNDTIEAMGHAESGPEFARLTSIYPPGPWE